MSRFRKGKKAFKEFSRIGKVSIHQATLRARYIKFKYETKSWPVWEGYYNFVSIDNFIKT